MNYSNHEKRHRTRHTAESFLTLGIQAISSQEVVSGFLVRYGTFIKLTKTPCNYGGFRHWFACPRCGKRVSVLYGVRLQCRHCANVVNASSQMGRQARNLAQIWRTIERYRLDVDALTRLREWHKPQRMHRAKWQRIMDGHNDRITQNYRYLRQWLESTGTI